MERPSRRSQVLRAQLRARLLGETRADLAQQLGDGRGQQQRSIRAERDTAVDNAIADRISQHGLAGVVGEVERSWRVVRERVGDLAAGSLGTRSAAGGSWVGAAWWVCGWIDSVVMAVPPFHLVLNYSPFASVTRH